MDDDKAPDDLTEMDDGPSDDAVEAGARAIAETVLGDGEYDRMKPWEQALYRTALANAVAAVECTDKPRPIIKKWTPPHANSPARNGRKPVSIAWDAHASQVPTPDPLVAVVRRLVAVAGITMQEFRDQDYRHMPVRVVTARKAVWRWMSRRGANALRLANITGVTRAAVSIAVRKPVDEAERELLARFDLAKEAGVLDGQG